jgi:flagellar motor switch protein FliN/FliY
MQTEQNVTILLGETQKDIGTVLNWTEGSLIEVDTIPGQPIDVMVNDRLCFRGTVVVGEHFGIQIDEILGSDESV